MFEEHSSCRVPSSHHCGRKGYSIADAARWRKMLALELQDSKCLVFVLRILWTLPPPDLPAGAVITRRDALTSGCPRAESCSQHCRPSPSSFQTGDASSPAFQVCKPLIWSESTRLLKSRQSLVPKCTVGQRKGGLSDHVTQTQPALMMVC